MAFTTSLATLWSQKVLLQLEKALIYSSPFVCNRDYEGDITDENKSVKIHGVYDPVVKSYEQDTDIEIDTLTDFEAELTIDQGDYYAFQVDDVQALQQVPKLTPQALVRAAYKLADTADKYVATAMSAAAGTTALDTNFSSPSVVGSSTAPSAISVAAFSDPSSPRSAFYEYLVDLSAALTEVAVPREGRFVICPPWAIADLNKDLRFTGYPGYGGSNTVLTEGFAGDIGMNGLAGRVAGLNVIESLNTPTGTFTTPTASNPYLNPSGTSQTYYQIIAGVPEACTFANQILKTQAYMSPTRFADVMRGLHVYGFKAIWPERLVGAYIAQGS